MQVSSDAQHPRDGGERNSLHQVRGIMKMVSSQKWRLWLLEGPGEEIIKRVVDVEGSLCTGTLCHVYCCMYSFSPHSSSRRTETTTRPSYR